MSIFEDEFFFDADLPDEEEEGTPSNVPEAIIPLEKPAKKKEKPLNISKQSSRDANPSLVSRQKLEQFYNRISPYISPEQRKYTKQVIRGEINVDTKYEMEILIRQFSLLISEVMPVFMEEKRVSRDLAATADSLRQMLKDLRDFEKDDAEAAKQETNIQSLEVADQQRRVQRLNQLLEVHGETQA